MKRTTLTIFLMIFSAQIFRAAAQDDEDIETQYKRDATFTAEFLMLTTNDEISSRNGYSPG